MPPLSKTGYLPPQGAMSVKDAMKFNANNGMTFSEPDANGFVYPNNDIIEDVSPQMQSVAGVANYLAERNGDANPNAKQIFEAQGMVPNGMQAPDQATAQYAAQQNIPGLMDVITKNRLARLGAGTAGK